jgi:hypothetical protein
MNTARQTRFPAARFLDNVAFAVCLAVMGAALAAWIAFAAPDSVGSAQASTPGPARQPPAGTFTGAYVDGAPVYRLPTITVSASRE